MILKSLPLEKGDLEGFYVQCLVKTHVYLVYGNFTSKVNLLTLTNYKEKNICFNIAISL